MNCCNIEILLASKDLMKGMSKRPKQYEDELVKNAYITIYKYRYEKEHLDGEIELFTTKLNRPDIADHCHQYKRPYTRDILLEVLHMCSVDEIEYVGF